VRKFIAMAATTVVLQAATTVGAAAYTRGVAPNLLTFTCSGSTITLSWDKNAGKPVDYTLSGSLTYTSSIPGSRGAKGNYTTSVPSIVQSGQTWTASLRNRDLTVSNTITATCT